MARVATPSTGGPNRGLRLLRPALLTAVIATAGCHDVRPPLATTDAFFASPARSVSDAGSEAAAIIDTGPRRLDALLACGGTEPATDRRDIPELRCNDSVPSVFGRPAEAYRRWAEDRVRELPAASDTAAGAGGG